MQLSLAPQIIVGQLLLRPTSASAQVLACQKGTITIDNTIDSRLQLVMEQARYLQHKTLC
jgi:vacuolar-type H+-ATPase subunit E/Vma4